MSDKSQSTLGILFKGSAGLIAGVARSVAAHIESVCAGGESYSAISAYRRINPQRETVGDVQPNEVPHPR